MKQLIKGSLYLVLAVACSTVNAMHHRYANGFGPAILVLAEERFNPTVQRLMAKEDLKLLPIADSPFFFMVPEHQDPYLEESQIRYLEELINKLDVDEPTDD